MKKAENSVKTMTSLAMLAALSIILGKYLQIPVGDFLRFSFENMPILFAGIFFGPVSGALVGACADLIGCLLVGYAINPIITLASMLIGILAGVTWRLTEGLPRSARIALAVGISHVIGSVIIKSIGLSLFYSMPFEVTLMWRLLNYIIVGIPEGLFLYILASNPSVISAISKIKGARD